MKVKLFAALLCVAARAGAQDSTAYAELRFRASALSNPVAGSRAGGITHDWHPLIGKQLEVATPLAVGEFGVAVGRVHYKPLTGKPQYKATFITLAWLSPEARVSRLRLSGGLRLTDYRMDFDDPTVDPGLRTEEEVMPGVIAHARLPVGRRVSLIADASYGLLMLGVHTRMVMLTAGAEYAVTTPAWLRDIMR
jgi:hypothetical protein